jgi:hypothetical protein
MRYRRIIRVMTVLAVSIGLLAVVMTAAPVYPVYGNRLSLVNPKPTKLDLSIPSSINPMQVGITATTTTTPTSTLTDTTVLTPTTSPTSALTMTPTATIIQPTPTATPTEVVPTPALLTPQATEPEISPTPVEKKLDGLSNLIKLIQNKPLIPLGLLLVVLITALTLILVTAQRKIKAGPPAPRIHAGTAPLPPKITPVKDRAFLVLKAQPDLSFPLAIDDIRIGRAADNTIVITPDMQGAESVSRYHARLYRIERWILEDMDSTNGIYVNGQRTGRNYLRDGWEIGIGGVIFIFHTGNVEV